MPAFSGLLRLGNHLTDGICVAPRAAAGYADQPLAVDAVLSGVGTNNAQIAFGPCTSDWGAMQYAALLDPNGNQIIAWALPAAITVTVAGNNQVLIAAGTMPITFGPAWAANLVRNSQGQIVFLGSGEPQTI